MNNGTEDPYEKGGEAGESAVVDPNAAANRNAGAAGKLKEKKIPDDKRTTTPYMTKYEKARILGTRALQIRYGRHRGIAMGCTDSI